MWLKILNFLKNILNSKLFLYCVIGIVIWFWIKDRKDLKNNVQILENNQTALAIQSSREIDIKLDDFKRLFPNEDSIVKKVIGKSKPSQVIVNNYHYKDTTIVETNLVPKDSTKNDTLTFLTSIKCYSIGGEVINNKTIRIQSINVNDKLYTIIYQNYTKKFLGFLWKQGKYMDAVIYSECMQDTISIERNIKIIKK